jgi:hypothetical protein
MRAIGLATPVAIALCALIAAPASARDVDRGLRSLGDEFLAHRLAGAPHLATALGSHDQDDRLVPVTQATLEEDRAWYRDLRARIEAIPVSGLAPESARERAWLAAGVERALVELEVTRTFERDPGAYVPLVAGSVRSVMERAGASPCSRVNSAARRLAQVPEVLRAAAINLQDPPAVLVSVAIERYSGVLRFYRESVPKLAFNCRDARLQADLAQADTAAVRAVEAFLRHLREDLSAQPGGPLALGRDACQRLLDNELQESVPVESLFAEAGRAVESERARMTALLAQAPADDAADEPTGGGEAASTDHALGRVQTFLRERALVTLPGSGVTRLAVREASPDGRTVEPVTLDGPGPWELRSREAWLDVVPADSSWSAPRRLAHLARFAPGDIDLLVMREAMPGRHLRALALQGMSSRLRRALQWDWRADGWAGYCEAMVVDEGYSAEPRFAIAYERSALRNHGRALAALGLHLGSMTFEDARRMLEERCALPADDAEQEARMAASDPAAMGYTHAVFGLLELRDQARRRLGSRFRIQVFNDAVLRYGGSPIGIVREAVLRELGDGDGTSGARP